MSAGYTYGIEGVSKNSTAQNFVINKGSDAAPVISGTSALFLSAPGVSITGSSLLASITSKGIDFPGAATATVVYDFAAAAGAAAFPVTSVVYVDLHDGLGVLASCALSVGAGNVPAIGSQSAAFSEAGVTAATFSVVGTTLELAITGKTVGSTGTVRLCRTG